MIATACLRCTAPIPADHPAAPFCTEDCGIMYYDEQPLPSEVAIEAARVAVREAISPSERRTAEGVLQDLRAREYALMGRCCSGCGGTGSEPDGDRCTVCGGSGRVGGAS